MASFDEVQAAISRQEKAQKDFEIEKKNISSRYEQLTWDQYQEKLDLHYDFSIDQIDRLADLWATLSQVDKGLELESKETAA